MTALACPFCGATAAVRADSSDSERPFYVRCSCVGCPGYETHRGLPDPETAIAVWNQRATPSKATAAKVADIIGFTKRNLIRGELVALSLDAKGFFASDQIEFSSCNAPLVKKPVAG